MRIFFSVLHREKKSMNPWQWMDHNRKLHQLNKIYLVNELRKSLFLSFFKIIVDDKESYLDKIKLA